MKLLTIAIIPLTLLCACSSPGVYVQGSEEQMEYDVQALSDHSGKMNSYRDWLEDAREDLVDQQNELQSMIDDLEGESPRSISALELQNQLQTDMMDMSLNFLLLQQSMQQENRMYSAIANIMKVKHEAAKNSIGNIKG